MNAIKIIRNALLTLLLAGVAAQAGPLDPDCTAEKAAKSTAMKATVGVGGRCSPKEAASDTAKRAADIEEKGPIEKRRKGKDKNEGMAKKAAEKVND